MRGIIVAAIVGLTAILMPVAVHAQSAQGAQVKRPPCGAGFVQDQKFPAPVGFMKAAFTPAALAPGQLRLDFVGHSSFLITSPQGVKVITDYNDNYRAKVLPDIATMSSVHDNHTTTLIDPSITHALHGWNRGGGTPRHDVTMKDLRVYSVEVNVGVESRVFYWPTSVFVVESHGMCIAHFGLIAQVLDDELVAKIGHIDVMLVPIDRRVTQSMEEIIANIKLVNPKYVVPMHYNSEFTVEDFLRQVSAEFPVRRPGVSVLIADKATLPKSTEVLYLKPPVFSSGF